MLEKLNPIKLFDDYSLKARFMPAFIATIPFLFFIGFKFGVLHDLSNYKVVFSLYFCTLTFLSYKTRNLGKEIEKKIIIKNNFFPTTYMLSFQDPTFDTFTKKRYLKFLNNQNEEWELPLSKEDENNDPNYLEKYNAAIIWLKNRANNNPKKYPLVYKELVKYGFNRNLLGIKNYCLLIYFLIMVWEYYQIKLFTFKDLFTSPWPEYAVFILFVISFLAILSHTKKNVISNAESYARTLIETCDN
ncbi:MAG: hypothetical protein ACRCZO_15200 [Cetobacterium sp.]|uniref:hypothetical protein n=1 Tax=Cetobacterium sp. TaxID=2071632 RepID=UPI003EE4D3BB